MSFTPFSASSHSKLILLAVLVLIMSQHCQSADALLSRTGRKSTIHVPPVKIHASEVEGEHKRKRKERVKLDEKVVFFPTAARRSEDGASWEIPIHGWIYEPETTDLARRAIMTSIRKYIGLKRDEEATTILKRRIGSFMVDNERRKEISIQIGCDDLHDDCCRVFKLPKSKKNGHFEAILTLNDGELQEIPGAADGKLLHFKAVTESNDDRVFEGYAQMIPPTGVSVISDIDDTVKFTGVGNKKQLLRSTFMEEFREVPGMSELYQKWSQDMDAKFHFVSSSPWQLWEELAAFLKKVGFPDATYHLKPVRVKDRTLFNLWKSPLETKIDVIESIFTDFPQRKFLLVGDTGEKDPEVYGIIARKYPDQVKGIYVRNVTGETGNEERYAEAWLDVNREICALFNEPCDIRLSRKLLKEFKPKKAKSDAQPVEKDVLKP